MEPKTSPHPKSPSHLGLSNRRLLSRGGVGQKAKKRALSNRCQKKKPPPTGHPTPQPANNCIAPHHTARHRATTPKQHPAKPAAEPPHKTTKPAAACSALPHNAKHRTTTPTHTARNRTNTMQPPQYPAPSYTAPGPAGWAFWWRLLCEVLACGAEGGPTGWWWCWVWGGGPGHFGAGYFARC